MPSRLKIVRGRADEKTGRRKSALVIDGQQFGGGQTQLKILRFLYENLGRVVPYERLGALLKKKSDAVKQRHTLAEYVSRINTMLADNRAPYVIAVAPEAGYALCKVL